MREDKDIDISVIIPCFNSEDTIGETLKSVLAQKTRNMEIIVVDDGSEDNTRKIVSSYSDAIRYVYQENSGVSAARNFGAALAEREWLAFCDADDVWYPGKIRICAEVIRNIRDAVFIFHDYSVIYGDVVVADRGTHSEHTFFPLMKQYRVKIPDILSLHRRFTFDNGLNEYVKVDTYSGNGFRWMILGNFIMPSSVVMKKSLFMDAGGFDRNFIVAEDTELFLRLARSTDFTYIDKSLHGYRRTPHSLISKYLKETILFGIKGIEKNCTADKDIMKDYGKTVNQSLGRRMADLAYFHLTDVNRREAFQCAVKGIRYNHMSVKAWGVALMALVPAWMLRRVRERKRKYKGMRP